MPEMEKRSDISPRMAGRQLAACSRVWLFAGHLAVLLFCLFSIPIHAATYKNGLPDEIRYLKKVSEMAVCPACSGLLTEYNNQVDKYNALVDADKEALEKAKALVAKAEQVSSKLEAAKTEYRKLEKRLKKLEDLHFDIIQPYETSDEKGKLHRFGTRDVQSTELQIAEIKRQIRITKERLKAQSDTIELLKEKERATASDAGEAYLKWSQADHAVFLEEQKLEKARNALSSCREHCGAGLVLQLPEPHDLTATVSREAGNPPLLHLPVPHDLKATVSRDPIPIIIDQTCEFGVAEDGTCLPPQEETECPFGMDEGGQCLEPDDTGSIGVEVILVDPLEGNNPLNVINPVEIGDILVSTAGQAVADLCIGQTGSYTGLRASIVLQIDQSARTCRFVSNTGTNPMLFVVSGGTTSKDGLVSIGFQAYALISITPDGFYPDNAITNVVLETAGHDVNGQALPRIRFNLEINDTGPDVWVTIRNAAAF